ncbi:MAG: hypothetical protein MZV64_02250 [Ignavibacteriales bacterium]|nr:hypothetical protein [Ignavibacteriales bacterium]
MTVAGMPNSARVFMIRPAVWLMVRSSARTADSAQQDGQRRQVFAARQRLGRFLVFLIMPT